ncbi:hypothetical protein FCV25MIE_34357, partial [Fagus crenata]
MASFPFVHSSNQSAPRKRDRNGWSRRWKLQQDLPPAPFLKPHLRHLSRAETINIVTSHELKP